MKIVPNGIECGVNGLSVFLYPLFRLMSYLPKTLPGGKWCDLKLRLIRLSSQIPVGASLRCARYAEMSHLPIIELSHRFIRISRAASLTACLAGFTNLVYCLVRKWPAPRPCRGEQRHLTTH